MKTNWKKFSVLFIAALISVSCGSDNKATGDAIAPVVDNTPIDANTSGNSGGAKDFAGFINEVEAGRFNGNSNVARIYTYRKSAPTSTQVHTSFWNAFKAQFKFESCFGSSCQTQYNQNYKHRYVHANGTIVRTNDFDIDEIFGNNLIDLKRNLVDYMKSADSFTKCVQINYSVACGSDFEFIQSGLGYYLDVPSKMFTFNSDGLSFIVDLNYPLAANPVGLMDIESGETYILNHIQ